MNWSSKWGEPKAKSASQLADEQASEAKKVWEDVAKYGTGYSKDGKHIPLEQIYVGIADDGAAANEAMKALGVPEIKSIIKDNKTISVTVVGDLGLDFEDEQGWNIYHLPTLATFNKAVPGYIVHGGEIISEAIGSVGAEWEYIYDKQPLLNWMRKVQENYPTSWQMLRLLTPDNYLDKGETAKEIIQKWCLSVKVE